MDDEFLTDEIWSNLGGNGPKHGGSTIGGGGISSQGGSGIDYQGGTIGDGF